MDNQTAVFVTEIIKGVIGIAFVVATPFAIKTFRAIEEKAKTIIGANNFEYAKDYIENEYKLHADLFSEENLITLLDTLDDKFGDRLSKDTIRKLVDLILDGIKANYTTFSVENKAQIAPETEKVVEPVTEVKVIDKSTNETVATLDNSGIIINDATKVAPTETK